MMTSSDTSVGAIAPIRHREAMALATVAYERLADLLDALGPDEWRRPTECAPWDVRDMASHVLGLMRASASMREQIRQLRAAKRIGGPIADAMSALHVRELADLGPDQIAREIRTLIPAAVQGRRRIPAPVRRLPLVTSVLPATGVTERWRLGYLTDVILTRDVWMHRVDISRATGRDLVLSADHDGRLIADLVADWARRHGQPFRTVLEGPAGGTYHAGTGGPELRLDAVEFCRALSGRAPAEGLLAAEVPF